MAQSIMYTAKRKNPLSLDECRKVAIIQQYFSLSGKQQEIPPPARSFNGEDFVIFPDALYDVVFSGATVLPSSSENHKMFGILRNIVTTLEPKCRCLKDSVVLAAPSLSTVVDC